MSLKKFTVFFFTIVIACGALVSCESASERTVTEKTRIGAQFPKGTRKPQPPEIADRDLGWRLQDGRRQTIADYKGKVVILDFWATYCPPCIEGIPHFNKLQQQYGPEGLVVLGLNVGGAEDQPKVPDFIRQFDISYPLGVPEDTLTKFYFDGDSRIPQTLVFDRNGHLVQQFVSFNNQIKAEIDKTVLEALKTR